MREDKNYNWHPIEEFKTDPSLLEVQELKSLLEVWFEQKGELEKTDALTEFNERLNREWAIETGLLERIYAFDRGITQLLLREGIDASLIPHGKSDKNPEEVVAIINDQKDTIEGLFSFVKGDRILSTSYIKELHAQLTRNQRTTTAIDQFGKTVEVGLISGDYKKRLNNPSRANGSIHEYCPPEQVASEMDQLIEMHQKHENDNVSPEVEAAWLHHRFTQIHPFQDGNGRVARVLTSLVFIKNGWFPLVIRDIQDERQRYIEALETADNGDLEPLINVLASAQKKAFVQALGISSQIKRMHRFDQVFDAVGYKLSKKRELLWKEWENVKDTGKEIQEYTYKRFDEVAKEIGKLFREQGELLFANPNFFVDSSFDGDERDFWFKRQIVAIANKFGYYANMREYKAWTRLVLKTDTQSEILVSFHATGYEFRGIAAVSACFFNREETEENERQIGDVVQLSDDMFQINYKEETKNALKRYKPWLEDILLRGLETWRRGL